MYEFELQIHEPQLPPPQLSNMTQEGSAFWLFQRQKRNCGVKEAHSHWDQWTLGRNTPPQSFFFFLHQPSPHRLPRTFLRGPFSPAIFSTNFWLRLILFSSLILFSGLPPASKCQSSPPQPKIVLQTRPRMTQPLRQLRPIDAVGPFHWRRGKTRRHPISVVSHFLLLRPPRRVTQCRYGGGGYGRVAPGSDSSRHFPSPHLRGHESVSGWVMRRGWCNALATIDCGRGRSLAGPRPSSPLFLPPVSLNLCWVSLVGTRPRGWGSPGRHVTATLPMKGAERGSSMGGMELVTQTYLTGMLWG